MKKRLMFVIVGVRSLRFALCLSVIMLVASEGRADELIIADFEGPNPVDGVTVTPAAVSEGSTVTAVSDVPDGGGDFAAKTVLDADAGADSYADSYADSDTYGPGCSPNAPVRCQ